MSETILDAIYPSDLGLDGYDDYRSNRQGEQFQREAIEFFAYSEKRFVGGMLPPGAGKTLTGLSVAKLTGRRTVILTATRGLEKQYMDDHERHGLVLIHGRDNYDCGGFGHMPQMAGATCRDGMVAGCPLMKGNGCTYEWKKAAARERQLVLSNYDYWLAVNQYGQGLERGGEDKELFGDNPIELLILDEAPAAVDKLSKYLSCNLYERELSRWPDHPKGEALREWQVWAVGPMEDLAGEIRTTQMELTHLGSRAPKKLVEILHSLMGLYDRLKRISSVAPEEVVVEQVIGTKFGRFWSFDIVWPGRFAKQYLFRDVEKVVLMSATLRPKTMGLLGLSKDEYEFREWKRVFSLERGPIIHMPPVRREGGKITQINIKHGMAERDMRLWVECMDSFIEEWQGYKGIMHTVAYHRQRYIMEHSRFSRFMIGNTDEPDSDSASEAFEKFVRAKPPCILVSPSFGTGWNFIGDIARWQIITKVPFVPMQSKVMQARMARDESYGDYLAWQDLAQSAGRVQRDDADWGVTVICDGSLGFFMMKTPGLGPKGFADSVRKRYDVPKRSEFKFSQK